MLFLLRKVIFLTSVEKTQSILNDKIKKYMLLGYNNTISKLKPKKIDMKFILIGLQGQPPRYEILMDEDNYDKLIVLGGLHTDIY